MREIKFRAWSKSENLIRTTFPDNYWCNLYGCWCDIVQWALKNQNKCNGICDECEFGEERYEELK